MWTVTVVVLAVVSVALLVTALVQLSLGRYARGLGGLFLALAAFLAAWAARERPRERSWPVGRPNRRGG